MSSEDDEDDNADNNENKSNTDIHHNGIENKDAEGNKDANYSSEKEIKNT